MATADEPARDARLLPIGIVGVRIEAAYPEPMKLERPGARLVFVEGAELVRLQAHEISSRLPPLVALVDLGAARVSVEQDTLTLWSAGMYAGVLRLHVYAIAVAPAKYNTPLSDAAAHWCSVLPHMLVDTDAWEAMDSSDAEGIHGKPFWDATISASSLAELYRQLPSPPAVSVSSPLLRCTLFGYQEHSLAKILQREQSPISYCDPYYVERTAPCAIHGGTQTYAFDPERCEFLTTNSLSHYADVQGGILCDEMGVGKTIICIALILATLAEVSQPIQEPMASAVTSELALAFPQADYHGGDPVHVTTEPIVTGKFGAPSPGERISRRRPAHRVTEAKATETHEAQPSASLDPSSSLKYSHRFFSLAAIAAHRLRTTTRCAPELVETLPPHVQTLLGAVTAPFFHLWPPPPTRMSRVAAERVPIRVYMTAATLVLVPQTLLVQWQDEMAKHCAPGALLVLTISDMSAPLPPAPELSQAYDVVLLSHARFGREAGDDAHGLRSDLDASPLLQVYWKRVIIDEGNVLGGDSLVVRLCTRLRVERRWIVTGTPTQALVGESVRSTAGDSVKRARTAPDAWSTAERRNLERLKHLIVRFLRVAPFCGVDGQLAGRERDWHALMATGPSGIMSSDSEQAKSEWPAKRRLYDLLSRIMVRNRAEDVNRECPLPPLVRRVVTFALAPLERITYNVIQALIVLNAALSQERDRDYFFHASNRKALAAVMENLALACFHYTGQGLIEQAQSAYDLISKQISMPDKIALRYRPQAAAALTALREALVNEAWREHLRRGEVMYHVEHPDKALLAAWSANGLSEVMTADDLLALRRACVRDLDAEDLREELVTRGMQYNAQRSKRVHRVNGSRRVDVNTVANVSAPTPPTATATSVLPPGFDDIRVGPSSSTKLNGIIHEILAAAPTEKTLVFSSLDNVLFETAGALEVARLPHLFYVAGMSQHLRNAYASAFAHEEKYRCLLMSTAVGGRGLDLHCASRVILAEPVWQLDLESQAVKRAWRIGQTRPVNVTTYVMQDTFEQHLIERKHARLVAGDADVRTLTDDPGMREFVAHPRFVADSHGPCAPTWSVSLLGEDLV